MTDHSKAPAANTCRCQERQRAVEPCEVWIRKEALADRLGLSRSMITRLVTECGLPHLKAGRSIRFNYEAVLAWFERRGDIQK